MTGDGEAGLSALLLGGYLGLLSVVWTALIAGTHSWGRRWRISRPSLDQKPLDPLLVSICIPARNEAENIGPCVQAALDSRWPNIEVIVVNDRSEDDTAAVAREAGGEDGRLHIVDGSEPPDGWAGKPWACARGAGEARGQVICFVDADVRIAPDAVGALLQAMVSDDLRLISAYGSWDLRSFWERVLIPAVGWLIRGAVNLDEVNDSGRPEAFANGQLIMVERNAYESMQGHKSVKSEILEDVRLAEQFKRRGFAAGMRVAPWAFQVRLYSSLGEIIRGYTKNLYEGMGRQPSLALGAILFIFIGALLPWIALFASIWFRLGLGWAVPGDLWILWCLAVCGLQILFRWRLEAIDGRPGAVAFLHPVANVLLIWILLRSMFGVEATWKGRVFVDGQAKSDPNENADQ